MKKAVKTTFEEEQKAKDEAFLKLSPLQRMKQMLALRLLMRKRGVNYSYKGQKVKITRLT